MIYHVSKQGSDQNDGSVGSPFATIQCAANVANKGDRVIVHEGVYREWVRPAYGGSSDSCRITYEAAAGEKVVIKGSEELNGWENYQDTIWKTTVDSAIFAGSNPFAIPLVGDWVVEPYDRPAHLGDIYLNGKSFYEAFSLEEVLHPQKRTVSPYTTWARREETIEDAEQTVYVWFAVVTEKETTIYANFHAYNPNHELVEMSVRQSCFYPEKTGIDFLTVSGFEMAQAATPWAPPTANQPGMLGPNWAKGWIVENCILHDSKCVGITLGKEAATGDNDYTKWNLKSGYHNQMEAVFRGIQIGWEKEKIGSHIVRNNKIYDCGQAGIVGHMGCAFSEVYGNEIYRIGVKHEFFGHEIGGIKFHAAIDVQIHDNYIHHCTLGTWLDWEAQGTRVSRNIFDYNNRDLMIEVTHGPCLVENNIFTAPFALVNAAQGTAFVHNLICGFMQHYPVLERATPYHYPHSTRVLGNTPVYGNDDRWYQNIFIAGTEENQNYGTGAYQGAPVCVEEYVARVKALGHGDVQLFAKIPQPAYIDNNVYFAGACAFEQEKHLYQAAQNPEVKIVTKTDGVHLQMTLPPDYEQQTEALATTRINTEKLGMTLLSNAAYETPEGKSLTIEEDLCHQKLGEAPMPGPVQGLQSGWNDVLIFPIASHDEHNALS